MSVQYLVEAGKTLKAKHRNSTRPHIGNFRHIKRDKIDPPEGTLVYAAGNSKSKAGGNHGESSKVLTLKPRQRAYGPF